MASPAPDSQTTPPPPSEGSSSSPPPPSEGSSSSPPPPSEGSSSSPPPPSEGSSSSPPPPSEGSSSSPPPPSEGSSSSPPPSTPPSDSSPPPPSDASSSSSSPPPPLDTSGSSKHSSSAPSRSALAPPKSSSGSSSKSTSSGSSASSSGGDSDSSNTSQSLPIIIGVVVGAGLLLLVMISVCVACRKKKKKKRQPDYPSGFYAGPPPNGGYYYSNQHQNQQDGGWYSSSSEYVVQLPTQPGMRQSPLGRHPSQLGAPGSGASPHMNWPQPPPPFMMNSGDMYMSSGGHSSSHGSSRRPPHPSSSAPGFAQGSFSYEDLEAATGGFSQNHIIGQGGFGYVFKGALPNGKEVAVKCLKSGSGQGDREFQAEVEIISRVHHRHLVSLEGYCIAGEQRILVYEFVPNSTLEHHLHGKDRPTMDWSARMKIALGSAKGLAYLHEDCHPRIIHRDIKGANILLDHNFEAKVADFGLAKLTSDNNTHVSTRVMGTFGYLAPEYAASGKLTEKSDTFSFGVMLLELVTGRRPVDVTGELMEDSLVDWARPLIDSSLQTGNYRELIDPRLEDNFNLQEMVQMVACAGACTRHSAKRRPKMSQVVRALEGEANLEDLNAWNNKHAASTVRAGENSSGNSSEYDSSYTADMSKLGKVSANSQGYSSETGGTSD